MDRAPVHVVPVGVGTAARLFAFLVLVTGVCLPLAVQAATIYVRAAGDDANDGLSPAGAVQRITRAAALAQPGDHVVVGPGTYYEGDIAPGAFGRVSFVADRRGATVGEPAGNVVVDAASFASGFELNHHLAVSIDGFVIRNAPIGIYVKSQSDQVVISNNVVSNNSSEGIYVQDSKNAVLFNNLVYKNGRSGILITGNETGSPGTRVVNNTIYGNGDRGIFIAGSRIGSPSGVVINNALQGNATAGIQVNAVSRDGYLSAGNVSADRFASRTPVDVTDVQADPSFVDPAGPDQILGGQGFADDDFHLSHRAAGQPVTSPAVNAGSDQARWLRLGRATTRTDGRPDTGRVDAGFHYQNYGPLPLRPETRLRYKPLYVSAANGADTNDGATRTTALLTVARALEMAQPGHCVRLLAGNYREGELLPANSGKPGRDLLIQAMPGAVIDASGFGRGILISGRNNITFTGIEVTGASTGIEVRNGSKDITLRRNRLHQNGRRGLYVSNAFGVAVQSSTIDGNGVGVQVGTGEVEITGTFVKANSETGLWAFEGSTATVSNSHFVDNARNGVLASRSDVTIVDGSISGSKDGGARFTDGSTGTLVRVAVVDNTDVGVQAISSAVDVSGGRIEGSQVGIDAFVDPVDRGDNQLAVAAARVCGNRGPGVRASDTALSLTDVTLCENGGDGLRQSAGSARVVRAQMTRNQGKGLSIDGASEVVVQDSWVGRSVDSGVQLVMAGAASLSGSVIHSSGGSGLVVLDTNAPRVWNNLIYGNAASGVLISGNSSGSPGAQVLNNTIFGNGNRGLLIGGSNYKPPSEGAVVLRNILQGNGVAGVQVNELSVPGYVGDYNLSVDPYYTLTPVGPHDVLADPLLVLPAGADGVLGGAGADDDDFHLSQRPAGQSASSPAVDAGGVDVITAGVQGLTTRTDGIADSGTADIGYHYRE